jgi:hypothetical protein
MKMASKATTEVILGLPPLHLIMEAEAQAGMYRLSCYEQWKSRSTSYRHTSKVWNVMKEPSLQMGTGQMILDMHSTNHQVS